VSLGEERLHRSCGREQGRRTCGDPARGGNGFSGALKPAPPNWQQRATNLEPCFIGPIKVNTTYEKGRPIEKAAGGGSQVDLGLHACYVWCALGPDGAELPQADDEAAHRSGRPDQSRARGVYVNPQARSLPADIRRGLIRFLRPREISYISLESKLSEASAISQVTTALTCMTTGSPGTFETPWGIIEFTHTDRDIDLEKDVYRRDDGTLEATVARAVRDLRRVGRNVDLIEPRNARRGHRRRGNL
jgi:hypothetical protein